MKLSTFKHQPPLKATIIEETYPETPLFKETGENIMLKLEIKIPTIHKYAVYNNTAMKVWFNDYSIPIQVTIARDEYGRPLDKFSVRKGLFIAISKFLFKNYLTPSGIEMYADWLSLLKSANKEVDKAIKEHEQNLLEEERIKKKEAEEKAAFERRKAKKIAKKVAKREAQKKQAINENNEIIDQMMGHILKTQEDLIVQNPIIDSTPLSPLTDKFTCESKTNEGSYTIDRLNIPESEKAIHDLYFDSKNSTVEIAYDSNGTNAEAIKNHLDQIYKLIEEDNNKE